MTLKSYVFSLLFLIFYIALAVFCAYRTNEPLSLWLIAIPATALTYALAACSINQELAARTPEEK